MSDEQKLSELALLAAQREQNRLEATKRKQTAEWNRMRREMRRQASSGASSSAPSQPLQRMESLSVGQNITSFDSSLIV